jgi:hypothetical protein
MCLHKFPVNTSSWIIQHWIIQVFLYFLMFWRIALQVTSGSSSPRQRHYSFSKHQKVFTKWHGATSQNGAIQLPPPSVPILCTKHLHVPTGTGTINNIQFVFIWLNLINSFIPHFVLQQVHSLFPSGVLHKVWSSASSFNFQYPFFPSTW